MIHARMHKGSANTTRGAKRFCEELIAQARRASATGPILVCFDSGFWSADTIKTLARLRVSYTIGVRANTKAVATAIATIPKSAWVEISYTPRGVSPER